MSGEQILKDGHLCPLRSADMLALTDTNERLISGCFGCFGVVYFDSDTGTYRTDHKRRECIVSNAFTNLRRAQDEN